MKHPVAPRKATDTIAFFTEIKNNGKIILDAGEEWGGTGRSLGGVKR